MDFTLLRVPFFLEPDYPTDSAFEETNRVRLVRKWGGEQAWEAQKNRHGLKERGQEVGIEKFNLDRVASNTLASHRMVQWVTRTLGINAAEKMYGDLNSRHFEKGQKLNDADMLVKAAETVGALRPPPPPNQIQLARCESASLLSAHPSRTCRELACPTHPAHRPAPALALKTAYHPPGADPKAARSFLESDEGKVEIEAAQHRLARLGISGIPTLILGGKWQLPSGAVGAKSIVDFFRKIEAEGGAPGPPLFAGDLNFPQSVLEEALIL